MLPQYFTPYSGPYFCSYSEPDFFASQIRNPYFQSFISYAQCEISLGLHPGMSSVTRPAYPRSALLTLHSVLIWRCPIAPRLGPIGSYLNLLKDIWSPLNQLGSIWNPIGVPKAGRAFPLTKNYYVSVPMCLPYLEMKLVYLLMIF